MYGIKKKTRLATQSYTGSTWDAYGIKKPLEGFTTATQAKIWADLLSKKNPVGFEVFDFDKPQEIDGKTYYGPDSVVYDYDEEYYK